MSDAVEPLQQELERLQERNLYLEECNLRYVSVLDMLASSSDFQAELNRDRDRDSIIRATLQQIKRLMEFTYTGLYINSDENDFALVACEPPTRKEELESEVDTKIMDGSFAWAINQNHPVLHQACNSKQTMILHVISTQSRIRGMFVGLLPGRQTTVDAPSLNALSVILTNTAYALESATLYTMLRDHTHNLEQRVSERTSDLQNARQQAEAANRAKSAFLANMSHELRTPLNATIGFTDVVLSKSSGPLNVEQEEYLGYVLQSSRHLLELINDILDLSKVEAAKMELNLSDVTIHNLLGNCLIMVKELAYRRGVQLREKLAADLPVTVWVDERKLKQVIYNLLSNAIKFTPAGESVTIAARYSSNLLDLPPIIHEKLAGTCTVTPHYLWVSISDTGLGLKYEDLERIFNPFEQADNTETRDFEGTGLGLALTRKLLELHGGAIWAESAGIGKGSAFHFVLPV
ncbi:MAG: two-component sensor histidine kinase [Proteobacteria bacterium]|nr:two-component sensor histidine kinase [Pseudomonadota bacterium]